MRIESAVEWLHGDTGVGYSLASALPSGFAVYGVLDLDGSREQDLALLDALGDARAPVLAGRIVRNLEAESEPGVEQHLYSGWRYRILITTLGALRQRVDEHDWQDPFPLPDLLLPPDRGWAVTLLWDDSWRSIGTTAAGAERIEARLPAFERVPRDLDLRTTGRTVL